MREARKRGPRDQGNKEGSDRRDKPAKRAKDGSPRREPGVMSCGLREQPQRGVRTRSQRFVGKQSVKSSLTKEDSAASLVPPGVPVERFVLDGVAWSLFPFFPVSRELP